MAEDDVMSDAHRFYGDLAPWWPLISSPADYAEEASFSASLLATADGGTKRVLELGSGGGNNASHMKALFTMTLVDRSPTMLDASRGLNPECEHIEGDMRDVRLGRTFDAVFVHDAIDYMTTEADLRRAMETAFAHCRPGGVAVFVPDHTTERFEEDTDHGGHDGSDGRSVRYVFWTMLDRSSGLVRTDYVFLLRDADDEVEVVHDRHLTGLFSTATWLRLLGEAGFEGSLVEEETVEERTPRIFFVGRRPAA
jgi:SAM-dependent methyltransferase